MGKEFILERRIKMKKILSMLLVLVTLFSLCACGKSKEDMLRVRNLGSKSLDEIISKLASLGLSLRSEEEGNF